MTARKKINLVVITPERQVLEESTDALIVIPAHDGELGVLQDRAPLMCELGIGQLRYQIAGHTHRYFIDGGFAQVFDNHITVLTSHAVAAEDITPETMANAERALEPARGPTLEAGEVRRQARRRLSVLRSLRTPR